MTLFFFSEFLFNYSKIVDDMATFILANVSCNIYCLFRKISWSFSVLKMKRFSDAVVFFSDSIIS